jgi:hypothetical protein
MRRAAAQFVDREHDLPAELRHGERAGAAAQRLRALEVARRADRT